MMLRTTNNTPHLLLLINLVLWSGGGCNNKDVAIDLYPHTERYF